MVAADLAVDAVGSEGALAAHLPCTEVDEAAATEVLLIRLAEEDTEAGTDQEDAATTRTEISVTACALPFHEILRPRPLVARDPRQDSSPRLESVCEVGRC